MSLYMCSSCYANDWYTTLEIPMITPGSKCCMVAYSAATPKIQHLDTTTEYQITSYVTWTGLLISQSGSKPSAAWLTAQQFTVRSPGQGKRCTSRQHRWHREVSFLAAFCLHLARWKTRLQFQGFAQWQLEQFSFLFFSQWLDTRLFKEEIRGALVIFSPNINCVFWDSFGSIS